MELLAGESVVIDGVRVWCEGQLSGVSVSIGGRTVPTRGTRGDAGITDLFGRHDLRITAAIDVTVPPNALMPHHRAGGAVGRAVGRARSAAARVGRGRAGGAGRGGRRVAVALPTRRPAAVRARARRTRVVRAQLARRRGLHGDPPHRRQGRPTRSGRCRFAHGPGGEQAPPAPGALVHARQRATAQRDRARMPGRSSADRCSCSSTAHSVGPITRSDRSTGSGSVACTSGTAGASSHSTIRRCRRRRRRTPRRSWPGSRSRSSRASMARRSRSMSWPTPAAAWSRASSPRSPRRAS